MKMIRDISLGMLLAAALLFLFLAPAFATGSHHAPKPPPPHPTPSSSTVLQDSRTKSSASSQSKSQAKSSADARSQATSGSSSKASGGNAQQSLQNQNSAQGGESSSTGVFTSVIAPAQDARTNASIGDQATEVVIHGDTVEAPRIPVSTAVAGGTNTTAECRYSVGAGGQAAVAGVSFGWGRKDKDCWRVILADRFYDQGNPDAGDILMCRIKELREAFGPDCLVMLRRSRLPAVLPAPAPTAHQLEQREAFERGEHLK